MGQLYKQNLHLYSAKDFIKKDKMNSKIFCVSQFCMADQQRENKLMATIFLFYMKDYAGPRDTEPA